MKRFLIAALVLAVSGIAYYGISPLFRNIKVDEAIPTSKQPATAPPESAGRLVADDADPMIVQEMNGANETGEAVQVTGTPGHPASGTVRIVTADGKRYVRYENFRTINGPDIYIYLSKDIAAKEYIDLGRVKATEGNINYEIPAGTDVAEYPYVLTWCQAFGVLFNSAKVQ